MSIPVSNWYLSLGNFSFPTVFIQFNDAEKSALLNKEKESAVAIKAIDKINYVINHLPGWCFMHADSCAPTDSVQFTQSDYSVKKGNVAWSILCESEKVRQAFKQSETERIALHPYRRIDRYREFRAFIFEGKLRAMSQRFTNKHIARLQGRKEEIWQLTKGLFNEIAAFLPESNIVVDLYLTATKRLMIIDMNKWEASDPLLLKDWDQDWTEEKGLKLVPKPMRLSGDVSVSF